MKKKKKEKEKETGKRDDGWTEDQLVGTEYGVERGRV